MIKNLLASTIIATGIGIQNTSTNTAEKTNQLIGYSNIYTDNEYTNEILETSKTLQTMQYNDAWIGSGIQVRARAMTYCQRYIADNIYTYNYLLVLKNDSTLTTTSWITSIKNNPQIYPLIQNGAYAIGYWQTPSQRVIDFLNGADYYTYNTEYATYQELQTFTQIAWMSESGITAYYNLTEHIGNYIAIKCIYDYDPNAINDNGAFMTNMQPITEVKQRITWEVPTEYQYEVVDLPGMLFAILGMPFAWISTAFNFTIFPNTPYEINLSAILMAIIISLIAIYIIKRILK